MIISRLLKVATTVLQTFYILRNFIHCMPQIQIPYKMYKNPHRSLGFSFVLSSFSGALESHDPRRRYNSCVSTRNSNQPRVSPSIRLRSRDPPKEYVELHRLHKLWPSRFRNAPDFLYSLSAAHRLITERMPATVGCELLGSLEQTIGIGWINGFAAGGWTRARARDSARERETTRA